MDEPENRVEMENPAWTLNENKQTTTSIVDRPLVLWIKPHIPAHLIWTANKKKAKPEASHFQLRSYVVVSSRSAAPTLSRL